LKKRRTKDSQTLSKELQAGSTTTTATHTSTSPIAAEDSHHHHPFHLHHHRNHPANHSTNSAQHPDQSSATQAADGQTASMQSPALQPSPSTQQHGNAASIHNIIHPSQHNTPQAARTERTTKGKYSLEDFAIQRTLGTGSFGRVHLVQSKHNHRFYAIKVLKKAQVVKMKQIEHANDERRMLNRVRHPFLITLWGTWQDSRNLYMVMDFVEGGELFSLLRKSQVSRSFGRWADKEADTRPWIEVPQPRREILCCRGYAGTGVSPFVEHHLPRSQAGESAARSARPFKNHRLRLCQGGA
jgi:protein kinase A